MFSPLSCRGCQRESHRPPGEVAPTKTLCGTFQLKQTLGAQVPLDVCLIANTNTHACSYSDKGDVEQ